MVRWLVVAFLAVGCGSESGAEKAAQEDAGADAKLGLFGEQCIRNTGTTDPIPGQCDTLEIECGAACDVHCGQVVPGGPRYCVFTCQGDECVDRCADYGGTYNANSYACVPSQP